MELRATSHRVGRHDVVVLDGVADLSTAPVLQNVLSRAITTLTSRAHRRGDQSAEILSGQSLVIDLDTVTVLDDVALGLLIGAATRCRDIGADFAVVASRPKINSRLVRTRIDQIVDVRDSIA